MPAGPVPSACDGELPKRSTGTDCKSVGFGLRRFESYTRQCGFWICDFRFWIEVSNGEQRSAFANQKSKIPNIKLERGCSSMVELLPSKQATRVRFPSPA